MDAVSGANADSISSSDIPGDDENIPRSSCWMDFPDMAGEL